MKFLMSRSRLGRAWRTVCLSLALLLVVSALPSCATQQRHAAVDDDIFQAQPLGEEDSMADKAGEVGVVGLVVGVLVGGILLPLFLL